MDRLDAILFSLAGITLAVVLGLLGEAVEERVRTWWRARKYGGKTK
jgi:hypothetical protein